MKHRPFDIASVLLVNSLLFSCSDARDSAQLQTVSMNLRLTADSSSSETDAGGSVLSPARALAFVRHVEFYLPEGTCAPRQTSDDSPSGEKLRGDGSLDDSPGGDDTSSGDDVCEDKLRVEGPWVIDLMTGEATPPLDLITVPAGTYRRVDVRFEPADAADARVPADLSGATLFASGQYGGAAASEFDLRVAFNEDARFESEGGIELSAGGIDELVMALDLNAWFGAASLERCASDDALEVVDGRLLIDDGACSSLENYLKDALKEANRLK